MCSRQSSGQVQWVRIQYVETRLGMLNECSNDRTLKSSRARAQIPSERKRWRTIHETSISRSLEQHMENLSAMLRNQKRRLFMRSKGSAIHRVPSDTRMRAWSWTWPNNKITCSSYRKPIIHQSRFSTTNFSSSHQKAQTTFEEYGQRVTQTKAIRAQNRWSSQRLKVSMNQEVVFGE